MGALGVLAAGALCAAVLSVASRVPPTPIDTEEIPGVEIGGATEDEVKRAVRRDRRSGARRRGGKHDSGARDRGGSRRRAGDGASQSRGVRAGGSALPVAYGQSGGGAGGHAIGRPEPDGGPERPVSGTGPRRGSGGGDTGAPGDRGGGRQSEPGGGGGGNRAQPRNVPAPAPTPTQPAVGAAADDDDGATAPTGTAASEDDGEVEDEGDVETEPVRAAAIRSPTLARSGDSDGG